MILRFFVTGSISSIISAQIVLSSVRDFGALRSAVSHDPPPPRSTCAVPLPLPSWRGSFPSGRFSPTVPSPRCRPSHAFPPSALVRMTTAPCPYAPPPLSLLPLQSCTCPSTVRPDCWHGFCSNRHLKFPCPILSPRSRDMC